MSSWGSFLLGAVEVFAYGWCIALVFGPLFFFGLKFERRQIGPTLGRRWISIVVRSALCTLDLRMRVVVAEAPNTM